MPRVDRRDEISRAAFAGIAEHGFEGLRMRDVAARASVNIATVHYYFPSKEDLIAGAYLQLQRRFQAIMPDHGTPAERLSGHLTGVLDLLIKDAELRQVLAEVALRAGRGDTELAGQIEASEDAWLRSIRSLVRQGTKEGCWAVPVDPAAFAITVVAMMKGACMPALPSRPRELRAAVRQLLRWLIVPAK